MMNIIELTRMNAFQKPICYLIFFLLTAFSYGQTTVQLYDVHELSFEGPFYKKTDNPVRDVELITTWQHESGSPTYQIYGFYDGDGKGGVSGNVFKVRFTPTKTGKWTLTKTISNVEQLDMQKEGFSVSCVDSNHAGFWTVDPQSTGKRWYQRSNGSHPYIIGNTLYSFLSETGPEGKPTGGNIKNDVLGSAKYFNKLRFAITGDIYPHPVEKPFLDNEGNPTDNGDYGHRPNPKWFRERVDLAVRLCYEQNVIADIIMNGPDSEDARAPLRAGQNNGDYTPFLKYIAARYGSYPNVWLCLSNEYNIRTPKFSSAFMAMAGQEMKPYLPYNNPLSVHANQGNWDDQLNTQDNWNDHIIIQNKMKYMDVSADYNNLNYWIGDKKPVFNDELAYEGAGDGWTEPDVIEALTGALMGGGYGSSAHKHPISKMGHYFMGNFRAEEHSSADNLLWLRQKVNENIPFWELEPAFFTDVSYKKEFGGSRTSIFFEVGLQFRAMEGKDIFLLSTNKKTKKIHAFLPDGSWTVKSFDAINMKESVVSKEAKGEFIFSSPDSRAVLFLFTKNP